MENNLLFVYGTLRQGHGNHYLMEGCKVTMPCATIKGELFLSGRLPMVFEGEDIVVGEVYEIDSEDRWKRLDMLEGHPNWYERREVEATSKLDGSTVKVWVYFMKGESYDGLTKSSSGNYNKEVVGYEVREARD